MGAYAGDGTLAKVDGDYSEVYFSSEFIDLSVPANLEKFIKDGKPVDLGGDGSSPTGTSPLMYFSGNSAAWNSGVNKGTGGNFTMTGSVTDSTNEPVQLPYSPDAVEFRAGDYLSRNSELIGLVDGKTFTVSAWMWNSVIDSGTRRLITVLDDPITNFFMYVGGWRSDGFNSAQAYNQSKSKILQQDAGVGALTAQQWNHILVSYDLANNKTHWVLNGVLVNTTSTVSTNDNIGWTGHKWGIADYFDGSTTDLLADLSEIYFTDEFIDMTVQTNIDKFIKNGKPVFLGNTGELPTGTSAKILFSGDAADFITGVNKGTGGDFVANGTLSNSSNEPVELP